MSWGVLAAHLLTSFLYGMLVRSRRRVWRSLIRRRCSYPSVSRNGFLWYTVFQTSLSKDALSACTLARVVMELEIRKSEMTSAAAMTAKHASHLSVFVIGVVSGMAVELLSVFGAKI